MPARLSTQPGTLIDLAAQLHRDEAEPLDRLRTRDRAIGQRLGFEASGSPQSRRERARRLAAWLNEIPPMEDAPGRGGEGLRWVGLIAVLIGLLLGYGAAMALFYYDGSTPVNVVRILAVFVGLQAVTLLLFVLAALPGQLPGAAWLRDLSPAKLATLVSRWLPGESRDGVQAILGRGEAHQRVYRHVQKWQLLSWSQSMALAFNLAAVGGALQLIVFSDLSFGWSTTLDVETEDAYRFTEALSIPWQDSFRGDRPDLPLIELTQNYRAQEFEFTDAEARASAQWWPFLVMCMLVYGVLPRFVTLIVSRWRLGRATVNAMATTPGANRVLDRMTAAVVETRGVEHEADAATPSAMSSTRPPSANVGAVVRWAEVDTAGEAFDAGGGRSLDDDRQAIAALAGLGDVGPVRVRVKAWEPPVLEFLDFLGDLRQAVGDGRVIEVQPIGEGDRAMWQKKLASVGDPWLVLVSDDPLPNTAGDAGGSV